MYPGTQFNWYDQSEFSTSAEQTSIYNAPMFMVVSSFDKGPEELMEISGADFNNLFGTMYFEKHGQNAIQAQRIIDAGGKLLVKRVCAEDSTLANLVLVATVNTSESNKTDPDGNNIYLDDEGNETTEVTENPVLITSTSIKWESVNITGCKTFDELKEKAAELFNESAGKYPLIIFTDNGRGMSHKAVRIVPDYNTSRTIGKMFYTVAVFEGTTSIETQSASFDPEVIYANDSYGLDKDTCIQIKCGTLDSIYDAFVAKIADNLGSDIKVVRNYDLIYGYNTKGSIIEGLSVDSESIDINTPYGIELKEGTNGAFGDKPANTEAWANAIRAVYAGEVTDEIWDVDQHKISAICDANLPVSVKEAIADFVTFRKDCVFFRDLGLGKKTYTEIAEAYSSNRKRNFFIADYATTYQIKDPVTKKNIEVTMMYDFAACLVNHFDTNPYTPTAGVANGFILENAIKGTVNFTPIITPAFNQKQAMEDLRLNYAIFEDDNCVVQSCYSSQDPYTQLSFINNVLAIQEVARAVRTICPANRYTFTTATDLSDYAKDVDRILSDFASHFTTLEFTYTQNKLQMSQKIFNCSIKFAFGNWAQSEIFNLYAINNE